MINNSDAYRKIFENSIDLFFITESDGTFVDMNDSTRKELAINRDDDICSLNLKDFLFEKSDWNNYIQKIDKKGSLTGFDISIKRADNSVLTGIMNSCNVTAPNEKKIRVFQIHDISSIMVSVIDSAKMNLELLDLNKKLTDAYNTMTHQEKLASIGQLSAGVAHEINNPLAFVSSNLLSLKKYIEFLIQYDPVSAEQNDQKEYEYIKKDITPLIEETENGLHRIASITKSLKRFSRTDDNYRSPDYNLNNAIKDTVAISKVQCPENTEIQLELSNIPVISCYGNDINQVLLNLIINALQALSEMEKEHKGYVKIITRSRGKFVEMVVEDNGPGIKDDIADKIYDPFFTTKDIGSGTGLGLGLCVSIISGKHNGRIWLEKSVNPTCFVISLPINSEVK